MDISWPRGRRTPRGHMFFVRKYRIGRKIASVSVGFMAALHFAQLGNKVTLICEKQKVEKDFEATLSYLSRPRCVQALRNILFLYINSADEFLRVSIQAPQYCFSDSVVIVPDLDAYLSQENFPSTQKVLQGLALFHMFVKKQGIVMDERDKGCLQAGRGKPASLMCFVSDRVTTIKLNALFDQVVAFTAEHRKILWQELEAWFLE